MDALGTGIGDGSGGVDFGFSDITRGIKKVGKTVGKTLAKAAPMVLSAAGAAGAGAGCAVIGVPPEMCAKGGAALGNAAGKLIAKKVGVNPYDLGIDPAALVSGNPAALMQMGQKLIARKGVQVPLSAEEAIYVAGRATGLPPETVAVAQRGLALQKAVTS